MSLCMTSMPATAITQFMVPLVMTSVAMETEWYPHSGHPFLLIFKLFSSFNENSHSPAPISFSLYFSLPSSSNSSWSQNCYIPKNKFELGILLPLAPEYWNSKETCTSMLGLCHTGDQTQDFVFACQASVLPAELHLGPTSHFLPMQRSSSTYHFPNFFATNFPAIFFPSP